MKELERKKYVDKELTDKINNKSQQQHAAYTMTAKF